MRKIFLVLFVTAAFSHSLYADDPVSGTEYAKKGIIEYGGGVSFSGTLMEDSKSYSFGFSPHINYFFIDNIHFGISPQINYNYHKWDESHSYSFYSFSPVLSLGYVIGISDNLFFNISPNIGYTFFKNTGSYGYHDASMRYGLELELKYDLKGSLINIFLNQSYTDYVSESSPVEQENRYDIHLGVGFSLYL